MLTKAAKRIGLEVLGWVLLVAGVAALVLPGPGLLLLFGGLVVLSQQYEWAERRVEPIKHQALKAASDGVQTWPRIILSVAGVLCICAFGVFWGIQPPAPGWWPLDDKWWLIGGWGAGGTLIASGIFALGLLAFSWRNFRGNPYEDEDRRTPGRDSQESLAD